MQEVDPDRCPDCDHSLWDCVGGLAAAQAAAVSGLCAGRGGPGKDSEEGYRDQNMGPMLITS